LGQGVLSYVGIWSSVAWLPAAASQTSEQCSSFSA
jgi:hypothetical protein